MFLLVEKSVIKLQKQQLKGNMKNNIHEELTKSISFQVMQYVVSSLFYTSPFIKSEFLISYKKTDRQYYEWTDRYYKWTDEYYEWTNEYYEWPDKQCKWKNKYYEWEKSTTSDQASNNK